MKNTRSKTSVFMIFLATIVIGMVSGFAGGYIEDELNISDQNGTTETTRGSSANSVNTSTSGLESLIKEITPSVVNITNTSHVTGYFGQSRYAQSAGTGVVITSDGYVMTNKHVVVNEPGSLAIEVADGTQYPAKIIALSPNNDLAILKINADSLTPIRLGDSSSLALGQSVVAIGNTLGEFRNTVTEGIISGLDRTVIAGDSFYTQEQLTGLLQTDAAINPGNSGGPLIDQRSGAMVGINTAASTDAQNIGLAIPINQAKAFLNQHI